MSNIIINRSFKVKQSINQANYYALISISGKKTEKRKLEVVFEDVPPEWCSSVETGIKYFYHYFNLQEQMGLQLTINKLHTMEGDATPMTVFYVTVKCLSEMFQFSNNLISLDEIDGKYNVLR